MLQINWEIYSSMIIKRFGCAAIHNKALYKCIIHSVVHEVDVFCMCSEHHSWFISFKLACTCSNSNLNQLQRALLFPAGCALVCSCTCNGLFGDEVSVCFINSVIQCMTGLCSAASRLEKRLRNSRSSQTLRGQIHEQSNRFCLLSHQVQGIFQGFRYQEIKRI